MSLHTIATKEGAYTLTAEPDLCRELLLTYTYDRDGARRSTCIAIPKVFLDDYVEGVIIATVKMLLARGQK